MWYTGMWSPNGDQNRQVEINQYDITMATHYNITMSNDIARDVHCEITMGNDIAMCTYHGITIHNDVAMNLFYYVLFCSMPNYDFCCG